jgi:hypothetical protein
MSIGGRILDKSNVKTWFVVLMTMTATATVEVLLDKDMGRRSKNERNSCPN